jgi:hypothetical protein
MVYVAPDVPQDSPQDAQETLKSVQPPVSAGSIPDLLKIGSIPSNTAIEVETSVLEPVVFSQNFARFVFQPKGILNSNSKIAISCSAPGALAFYPINVGIYSLIQRATLKAGTKTICEVDDFAHFMDYQSMFLSGEANRERELFTTSRSIATGYKYRDPESNTAYPAATNRGSNTSASETRYDIGVDPDGFDNFAENGVTAAPISTIHLPHHMNIENTPVFQMALDDLFPFLKTNQLPLYMMKEQVSLELQFTAQTNASNSARACVPYSTDDFNVAVDPSINRNELKLIADYLYYPQEMMVAYQNSNQKMSFTYVDYRSMKRTIARTGATGSQAADNFIQNLGGAGRIVNKAIFKVADLSGGWEVVASDTPNQTLMNVYNAQPPYVNYTHGDDTSEGGTVTTNLKYNDTYVYPIDVDNMARHFHNIVQAEGKVPFRSREIYSSQCDTSSSQQQLFDDFGTASAGWGWGRYTDAQQFWQSIRLNKNERVNSRGIELYQKMATLPDTLGGNARQYQFMAWLELVRLATFEDGYLTSFFA